jgi:hypothetical protein
MAWCWLNATVSKPHNVMLNIKKMNLKNYLILFTIMGLLSSFKNIFNNEQNIDIYIEIAKIIYPENETEINNCFNLYKENKKKFRKDFEEIIEEFDFDSENGTLTELLYSFGEWKGKTVYIDWRGEENEGEIEEYISDIINKKIDFKITKELREKAINTDQRDGVFIKKLFNSIQIDLNNNGYEIMFFNIDWDGYGFTVINQSDVNNILKIDKSILSNKVK